MNINKDYPCNRNNYGSRRSTNNIKYIVIHYTGNNSKRDLAINNCKYFQSPDIEASAHYFVDETSIYQSVEDNITAWSVGGNKYSNCNITGGGKFHNICVNGNSVSIEMCNSVNSIPQKTKDNVKWLVGQLMEKYNIPKLHIIRHFDVTGKDCPHCLTNDSKWNEFKNYIINNIKPDYEPSIAYHHAIKTLAQKGIITSPSAWKIPNIKYLEALICKVGLKKYGVKDYDSVINCLADNKVINSKDVWLNKTYKIQYAEAMIIKLANIL